MPTYKLTYFDFAGSRGEECRLALHLSGASWVDERLDGAGWAARRASTPFGALPVLEVEGKGALAQSNAILAYLGRVHGLHPADAWQAARHEAVMMSVEDLRIQIDRSGDKDAAEKLRKRQELATGYLPAWGASVERQIEAGPFLAGERIQVADLKLYVVTRAIAKGGLDHVPADVLAPCPKLTRLIDAVARHPDVVRWNERAT